MYALPCRELSAHCRMGSRFCRRRCSTGESWPPWSPASCPSRPGEPVNLNKLAHWLLNCGFTPRITFRALATRRGFIESSPISGPRGLRRRVAHGSVAASVRLESMLALTAPTLALSGSRLLSHSLCECELLSV